MKTFTVREVSSLIAAFDATGVHRASTPGDIASGDWLAREAGALGADVSRVSVQLPRTVVDEAYVECGGLRIDGLPMFDSPPTVDGPIQGRLCELGQGGAIGYIELAPNAASIKGMRFEDYRRSSNHAAILVATRVDGESLAPINAQFFDAPFGSPVLQVAGMHHEFLRERARAGTAVTISCSHRREPAQSFNVAASVAGSGSSPRLVLLTPRTGWWESTAERGGGLVAWLAGLASVAALRNEKRLIGEFRAYATCGHELGHVGLHALLADEQRMLNEATTWLHLGANLGCGSMSELTLRASDPAEAEKLRALLSENGYPIESIVIETIDKASGEARDVVERGGRVLSLIGKNAHFHAASDRWPGNVNVARVAAIVRATSKWICLHADGGACV